MRFGLSEEQILLKDNVDRFLTDRVPLDAVRAYADGGDDADTWQGLAELGVAGLLVPEEAGGIGLKPLDAAIVAESLGYHVTPAPYLGSAVMAPTALVLSGGDHNDLLGEIAAGSKRVGIAFGEAIGRRNDAGIEASDNTLNGKGRLRPPGAAIGRRDLRVGMNTAYRAAYCAYSIHSGDTAEITDHAG